MESGGTDTLLVLLRDATSARAGGAAAAAVTGEQEDADDAVAGGGGSRDGSGGGGVRGAAADLARGAAGALRQLANSDAVKSQLAEAGALEAIMRWAAGCVRVWPSAAPACQLQSGATRSGALPPILLFRFRKHGPLDGLVHC
jgi:hypothetical protein